MADVARGDGVMELPMRNRHVGLATTTPLPPEAGQAGVLVLLLKRFSRVQWSADLVTAERVLAYLKADWGSAERESGSDAR